MHKQTRLFFNPEDWQKVAGGRSGSWVSGHWKEVPRCFAPRKAARTAVSELALDLYNYFSPSSKVFRARRTGTEREPSGARSASDRGIGVELARVSGRVSGRCEPRTARAPVGRSFNPFNLFNLFNFCRSFASLSLLISTILPLSTRAADQPAWSFRNHVQPVLAKNGCSAGACHGAAAGQNGFKLSLRGYDDEGDCLTLTRRALGRRIVPSDPGRRLMLLKPTGAVPHKGGKRFEVGSIDYKVLSEWIAAGTPGPKENEPRIQSIEIWPEHFITRPGLTQQLSVLAHFTDGHTEDVTHWVKY